jgi:hypothetical protein
MFSLFLYYKHELDVFTAVSLVVTMQKFKVIELDDNPNRSEKMNIDLSNDFKNIHIVILDSSTAAT